MGDIEIARSVKLKPIEEVEKKQESKKMNQNAMENIKLKYLMS